MNIIASDGRNPLAHTNAGPEQVVEAVERVGRLPAIPTHDWCEQAAAVAGSSLFVPPASGVVAVGVGSLQGDNIDRLESVGVHGVGSQSGETDEIRTRLRGIGFFPAGVNTDKLKSDPTVAVAPVAQIREASSWKSSAIGRLLTSRGLTAVLIGAGLIADTDPSRVLWVLGAVEDSGVYVGDMVFAMVILLAMLRRARLALSGVGRNSSDWISPREQEILKHLVLGKSVRQIAEETGRSAHTIHDHVKSLHRKLNATSRGELIARALGHVTQGARIREASRKIRQT